MTKLEEIAQALSQVTYLEGDPVPWSVRDEQSKQWCRRLARRAIEQMMEPSIDMLIEGQKAMVGSIQLSHDPNRSVRLEYKLAAVDPMHTKAEYRAMLQAILDEKP